MITFCHKPLISRSRYSAIVTPMCFKREGHTGKCAEFPFLDHLKSVFPRVAAKIKRDATMTTGASWKSDDAGPNRILRWVMLLPNEQLKELFGLDMASLPPTTQAKLREKAAPYEDCMKVAIKLTWRAYQMENAPKPDEETKKYLEDIFGEIITGGTVCEICRIPLSFQSFELAKRGRAEIETCHKNPRAHDAHNVGFGHRHCNVAQGDRDLADFYKWIKGIVERVN